MSKLQNIKAIRQLLDGSHRFQTRKSFTFYDATDTAERNKSRKVGEVWFETDPKTNTTFRYEQHDGYYSKVAANLSGIKDGALDALFFNCPKETCTCTAPNRLDYKFLYKTGMCSDCVISTETRMKIDGTFAEYAHQKMLDNATAFFREMDSQLDEMRKSLTDTGISFINEDGTVEQWECEDPEIMLNTIEQNYNEFKREWVDLLESKVKVEM